jgi:arylsulfatase A-like enzyme
MFGGRVSAVACTLSLLLAACRPASPPNVVIVLVDTLRADHLGCYGHPGGFTPFIDGLAGRGVRYARAYAASTWTSPSVASVFTSRWQSQTGVLNLFSVLPDGERTLAEVLHERGWATAGFLATRSLPTASGFGQGFEVWQQTMDAEQLKGSGAQLNQRAFAWLDARPRTDRRPVLLYLHYMEPHFPADPRPAQMAAVLAARGITAADRPAWNDKMVAMMQHAATGAELRPQDMEVTRDLYLAEVASLDQVMRELVDGLTSRGVLRNAVVVLTADHGEEFYEHGSVGHGYDLFDETLQVPLLILAPGRTPAVVEETVSLLAVAPTILDLLGLPPEPRFEGRALAGPSGSTPAYAELLSTARGQEPVQDRAVVDGARKLVTTPAGGEQFYDLARDPGEHDPDGLDPTVRAGLRETLDGLRARAGRDVGTPERRDIDEAARERLRALGYIK